MATIALSRLGGWALAASGVLFALFFVLHPGGGDPPTAATVVSSPYALEHTLGVAAMVLMLLGLIGLYAHLGTHTGKLGFAGFLLAFAGTALLTCVLYFDAYFVPIIARDAPQLLSQTGPLNTPPGLLALAIPGMFWGLGFILLGVVIIRSRLAPRLAGFLLIVGSIVTNLPPEPVGPTPLALIAAGSVLIGCALAWIGLDLAMDWTAQHVRMMATPS